VFDLGSRSHGTTVNWDSSAGCRDWFSCQYATRIASQTSSRTNHIQGFTASSYTHIIQHFVVHTRTRSSFHCIVADTQRTASCPPSPHFSCFLPAYSSRDVLASFHPDRNLRLFIRYDISPSPRISRTLQLRAPPFPAQLHTCNLKPYIRRSKIVNNGGNACIHSTAQRPISNHSE